MHPQIEAYLDVETTGLSPHDCEITVIGIHVCNCVSPRFVQLVGDGITAAGLLAALEGVKLLHTYNGCRFDLPFIHCRVGVELARLFRHRDLMFDCWRRGLRGGFKAVEHRLGIKRRLTEVDGYQAVRLWWRYVNDHDQDALSTLLEYNREDVMNLKTLKERLD